MVSAGKPHADIDLGDGVWLRSVGKLDLTEYATLLRGSAIGISLMISPHPSYPPIEMAHMGMLVLTNRFENEGPLDLALEHHIRERPLGGRPGGQLSELCRLFEVDPGVGDKGISSSPDYMSDRPQFPFGRRWPTCSARIEPIQPR